MELDNLSSMTETASPATAAPERGRRKRIPMSVPQRKLEVPLIEGYHLHWIKESNIGRALAAYYTFVGDDEVELNQRNPGTDTETTGNTDLGARVSITAGIAENGKPERLYLMKLEEEYWLADKLAIDTRNAQVMGSIFRGEKILDSDRAKDTSNRYVDQERTSFRPALFNRPRPKAI
jgi:hypothetical protein